MLNSSVDVSMSFITAVSESFNKPDMRVSVKHVAYPLFVDDEEYLVWWICQDYLNDGPSVSWLKNGRASTFRAMYWMCDMNLIYNT
jgi:hypothetical protein